MVQATAKGGSKVGKSGFRDLWLLTLTLIINAITVAVGLFQVFACGCVVASKFCCGCLWVPESLLLPVSQQAYIGFQTMRSALHTVHAHDCRICPASWVRLIQVMSQAVHAAPMEYSVTAFELNSSSCAGLHGRGHHLAAADLHHLVPVQHDPAVPGAHLRLLRAQARAQLLLLLGHDRQHGLHRLLPRPRLVDPGVTSWAIFGNFW